MTNDPERSEDQELLNATERVLTEVVERGLWNTGMPISGLRETVKAIDPEIIAEAANPDELTERLLSLPGREFDALVDRLDLEGKFPDAKP